MIRALATTTSALLLPSSALAADLFNPPTTDSHDLVHRLVLLTALLVAICIGISWWAKRALRLPELPPSNFIRNLDTITLQSGQTLHLLQVGSSQLAVSVNPDGIDTLCLVTPSFLKLLCANTAQSGSDTLP